MASKIEEVFGKNLFHDEVLRERLPAQTYEALQQTIQNGAELELQTADVIADAMMKWAVERGATHYTHWFQPLTGITAEKHESFIEPDEKGGVTLRLSGKRLIKGESDASSFPSGGLRATFEARGYTAWDCTSPAFLKEDAGGITLCIPTAFCSYNGEALDQKTPLLRSMEALNKHALRILRLFGDTETKRVISNVGAEQEYFLIDKEFLNRRWDIKLTGKTLMGAAPLKGQAASRHYYGAITDRVSRFMNELDEELWKLGITAKTKHNEAAPCQHEMAPVYATANIACDQNQLVMEMMKKVADRHDLVCLLHEKPFAGVNGSGKHNNWSITSDLGENLLDPGKTPNDNLQFLLVLSCIIKAVDRHADLLRMSTACVGNDHRLGANEAPPAIVSIFLGNQLEDVVEQIVKNGTAAGCIAGGQLDTGVSTLPVLNKDATDRNRTSPFAFTGNKFEFRMVGSSDCIATANTVLNTIVAEAFCEAADELEGSTDFTADANRVIAENLRKHSRVIFNGNGYSADWIAEAARRGLPNLPSMVSSVPSLTTDKAVQLFGKFGVFTRAELESRSEIMYETYTKVISIEARTMLHMAGKHYIPAVVRNCTRLADSVCKVHTACPAAPTGVQETLLCQTSELLTKAASAEHHLEGLVEQLGRMDNVHDMAVFCHDMIMPAMQDLRDPIDRLELIVDKDIWPVPTYGDLMFEV